MWIAASGIQIWTWYTNQGEQAVLFHVKTAPHLNSEVSSGSHDDLIRYWFISHLFTPHFRSSATHPRYRAG